MPNELLRWQEYRISYLFLISLEKPGRLLMLLKVTLDPITFSVLYIDNSNIDAERITEVVRIRDLLSFLISLEKYFLSITVLFGSVSNSL